MGAWNDNRPQVMALVCCVTGLTLLILSSVIFANRLGEEVDLWYNVPLCQSSVPNYWVSQPLSTSQTCATPDAYNAAADSAEFVEFPVEKTFFNPGFKYTTFLYRTNGSEVWTRPSKVDVEVVGGFAMFSTSQGWDETPTRRLAEGSEEASTGRRLLKGSSSSGGGGGYSSGPSFRSRNGNSYSYWGYGTPYYRRYGRTSRTPAVDELTVVSVYSPATIYGARATAAVNAPFKQVSSPSCQSARTGCEYTLETPLVKDELTEAAWVTEDPPDGYMEGETFTARIRAYMRYNVTGTTCVANPALGGAVTCAEAQFSYPNLFMVFATDQVNGDSILGYVLIPISCIILCCGTIGALAIQWTFCPDCGGGRKRGGYTQRLEMGGADSSITNPMHGDDDGPKSSVVSYPLPPAPGTAVREHDGDHRSLASVYPRTAAQVDLYENDVSSLRGISDMTNLQLLKLVSNNMRNLSELFGSQSLLALDVTSNDLSSLRGAASMQLVYLKAANNDITDVGGTNMPTLQYLCLNSNNLTTLDGVESMPSLTHVDFGNNSIRSMAALAKCVNLQAVDLSQNDLTDATSVMALATACPNLQVLDIRGNDFSAAGKQQIRDHFAAAKPACVLHS